jgi:hypothetical protein
MSSAAGVGEASSVTGVGDMLKGKASWTPVVLVIWLGVGVGSVSGSSSVIPPPRGSSRMKATNGMRATTR